MRSWTRKIASRGLESTSAVEHRADDLREFVMTTRSRYKCRLSEVPDSRAARFVQDFRSKAALES